MQQLIVNFQLNPSCLKCLVIKLSTEYLEFCIQKQYMTFERVNQLLLSSRLLNLNHKGDKDSSS